MYALASLLALLLAVTPAVANDEPDELVPGKITIIRPGKLAKFTARPPRGSVFDLPNPTNDPRVEGATLRIFDDGGAAGDDTYALPGGSRGKLGWHRIPENEASALRGYRYRGSGEPTDPCQVVVVTARSVKAACRGSGVTLQPPFSGDVAIVLTVGTDSKRYCAEFGGTVVKNTTVVTKKKLAPPPASCPAGGASCTCGSSVPTQLTFDNGVPSGDCGTVTGGVGGTIACGGLYFGGGLDSVPLPIIVPDFANPLRFSIDTCNGNTLTVGGTTEAQTGTNKECTTPGCLFGPPLPVPNPNSTPTSTCLYNVGSEEAAGTLDCSTGAASITVPLQTNVYLTGDLLPNRCQGGSNPGGRCTVPTQATDCPGGTCEVDPEVQPCPVCNPTTNTCNGGMNNGAACVPGSTELVTGRFPTSQDCRVSDVVRLGLLDIRLGLTTGTSSDTAVPSGTQARVFCGFCRDADGTGGFANPPEPCESNAGCAQPNESCEQRNNGAFGNGAATQLSATGSASGPLSDFGAHDATLVTIFCIPPTYSPIIDNQADLPGPGALTLPGTFQLSGGASPSGAFVDGGGGALY